MARSLKGILSVFSQRRTAYKDVFETEAGKLVLADLAIVCGARPGPLVAPGDPIATAAAAARMEVWNHIMGQVAMSEDTMRRYADQRIAMMKQQEEQPDYE